MITFPIPLSSISIGSYRLYFYSLMLVIGLFTAYVIAIKQSRKYHISINQLPDIFALTLVSGVIGARLSYVLQNSIYFNQHIKEIWLVGTGGLSIHGAIIAGLVALYVYSRRQQLSFFAITDTLALPLLAGQIVGRLGNYFNQELFGYPTSGFIRVEIDPSHRPAGYFTDQYFHPTFFYEMVLNGIGLFILSRFKFKKQGQLSLAYLLVFAVTRYLTEIWRISERVNFGLSTAQIISLLIIVSVIIAAKQVKFKPY